MRVVGLARAVADPDHVAGGAVPVAGGRILPRHRLLVAEQQRLVAGVDVGAAQLGMAFEIEPAGLHEGERLGDAVGHLLVAIHRLRVFYKTEHPLMHAAEARVAAMREGAQQVQGRGRLVIGLDQALRIGRARFRGELRAVDDVAAIARQLDAVALLGRRGARLGELAGDAADLHHRRGRREGEHHRHLQEHAEEVADRVRAVVLEALGAVAALKQESIAGRDPRERLLQVARLAGKNQRRKRRKLAPRPRRASRRPGTAAPGRSGFPRQLSGVQRSGMTHNSLQLPGLIHADRLSSRKPRQRLSGTHPSQSPPFRVKERWIPALPSVGRDDT